MEGRDRRWTRREILALSAVGLGAALAPRAGADAPGDVFTQAGVIVRNPRPLCVETDLEAFRTLVTPNDRFFVRSHLELPSPTRDVSLTIDGEVARALTLSVNEIRRMPSVTRLVTLECAGNGRGRFALPSTSGIQWGHGAVGTARFTGVPLASLLERAGVKETALHFWMEAADHAPLPATPKFLRSLPRATVLADALVAYDMNGEAIAHRHGGPLRLVVPSWYGMASTKWLTHVHARTEPSDNFFLVRGYRYADGSPVERVRAKSLVTGPLAGEEVRVGPVHVTGVAWTGTGTVRRVELSIDEGRTWTEARLTSADEPGAWRLFEGEVVVTSAGEHAIRARATDTEGNVQPVDATPNPGGYGNNSIHEVRVRARAA